MKENLLQTLQYEEWANDVILRSIQQCEQVDGRTVQLFAHVIAPQSIWLSRIRKEVPKISLWPDLTLEECAELMEKSRKEWREFIDTASEEELTESVVFKLPNSDAERKIAVYDVVVHLANHGTYHRGQIILGLKGKIEPLPLTTYIAFLASRG